VNLHYFIIILASIKLEIYNWGNWIENSSSIVESNEEKVTNVYPILGSLTSPKLSIQSMNYPTSLKK